MSNNKQIEKPLELPHQETIVGTNTIQTKPFDNQKINMSNNKQSSVDWFANRIKHLIPDDIGSQLFLKSQQSKATAMHKEEVVEAVKYGFNKEYFTPNFRYQQELFEQYYNETYVDKNN